MSPRTGYAASAPVEPRRIWSVPGLLDHVVAFLTVTLLGWLLSILLEWCGIALGGWDPPGAAHSVHLLRTELHWLDRDFTTPLVAGRLIEWASWGANLLYHWSGLAGFMRWVVSDQPAPWAGLDTIRQVLRYWGEYLLAAASITQLVGARLVVVVLTLPAYAMVGVMSLVDGLVQRDLRRFGGGLESGLLYHHLKAMLRPMLSLPIFLYLISPWSLHPTTIFVPFILGFGYFVQRTVARFKKYL